MTEKEIDQSIESMKLHLTKKESIADWLSFFFMLMPLSVFGFLTIYLPISQGEFPSFGLIVILAFFLLLRHHLVSPKLDIYKSELTEEQFKQANQAAAKLNEWRVLSNKKNYFSAIKGTAWHSAGIKITAMLKDGRLYLNSMVNPSIDSNPFTFGLNKKNKLALIRQYQSVLKGEKVVEAANKEIERREAQFWEESEWMLGNILMRIVGYGFIVIFLLIGILFIYEGTWEGSIPIAICIVISWTYVKSDIHIILEKRRRRK